jgi:hypothetical protein
MGQPFCKANVKLQKEKKKNKYKEHPKTIGSFKTITVSSRKHALYNQTTISRPNLVRKSL